jgi:hypothetical protein
MPTKKERKICKKCRRKKIIDQLQKVLGKWQCINDCQKMDNDKAYETKREIFGLR